MVIFFQARLTTVYSCKAKQEIRVREGEDPSNHEHYEVSICITFLTWVESCEESSKIVVQVNQLHKTLHEGSLDLCSETTKHVTQSFQ